MLLFKLILATLSDLAGTIFDMRMLNDIFEQYIGKQVKINLFISPDITRKQMGYTAAMDKLSRFSAYAIAKKVLSESSRKERTNTDAIDA